MARLHELPDATWIRGKHSVMFGGSMVQADVWLQNQTLIPTASLTGA